MKLCYENKDYVLTNLIPKIDEATDTPEEIVEHKQHTDDVTKVACIMIATMAPDLQKSYKDY